MEHDDGDHLVLFDLEVGVALHEYLGERHGGERAGLNGAERRVEAGGVVVLALDLFEFFEVGVEVARILELVVMLDKHVGVLLSEFGDGIRHAVACAAAGVELDKQVHGGHMAFVGGLDHVVKGLLEVAALVVGAAGTVADGEGVEPVGVFGMRVELERPDHAGVFAAACLAEIILDGEEVARVGRHVETFEVVGLGALVVLFRAHFAVLEFLRLQVDVLGGPAHLDVLADDVPGFAEVVCEDVELEEVVGVVFLFDAAEHAFRGGLPRFGGCEREVVVGVAPVLVGGDEPLSERVDVAEVDGGVQVAVADREFIDLQGFLDFLGEDVAGEGIAGEEVRRDRVAGARLALQELREVVDLARAAEHADDLRDALFVSREDVEELEHGGVRVCLDPDGVDALHENAGEGEARLFVLDGGEKVVAERQVEVGLHALSVFVAFAEEGMHLEILFGGKILGGLELGERQQILEGGLLSGLDRAHPGEAGDREFVARGDAAEFGGAAEVALGGGGVFVRAEIELSAFGKFIETESRFGVASGFLGDQVVMLGTLRVERGGEQCGTANGGESLFHVTPRGFKRLLGDLWI